MACGKILALLLLSLAAAPCRAEEQDGVCDVIDWGHSSDSVHDATHACMECMDNSGYSCTKCKADFKLDVHDETRGTGTCSTCLNWKDEYGEEWYEQIRVGVIVGIFITLVTTIVTSLPVCCGVMKESGSLKLIAILCGIIAGIAYAVPFISGMATRGGVVDDICSQCDGGCSDAGRKELDDLFAGLGAFVAYTLAFGFLVVILSSVTMCMACCICCPCCGPLKAVKDAKAAGASPQPAVQGQVIGQAPC